MTNAIRSIACAIGFAGSIIAAGLASGGGDQGYFVIVLGLIGFVVFGLLLIRLITGTARFGAVMEYLFSPQQAVDESDE